MPVTLVNGKTGVTVTGYHSNPTGEGIRVIYSKNITLDRVEVRDCLTAGILDYGESDLRIVEPDVRNNGTTVVPDTLKKDTKGQGITVQGNRTTIIGGYVADNGNDLTFEHGGYIAKTARNVYWRGTVFARNAASGLKLAGAGMVERIVSYGSPRGVVLAENLDLSMGLVDSDISGTLYAVMVESAVTDLGLKRFHLDYNRYPKGSVFSLRGVKMSITQWQAATGLDRNSREV